MKRDRRALLVRVGIDSQFGEWNAPIHPETGEYVYVPIPESRQTRAGVERTYEEAAPAITQLAAKYDKNQCLPGHLEGRSMHLDPDFEHLTYGDANARGAQLAELSAGDILVFYGGFEPLPGMEPQYPKNKVYALFGLFYLEQDPTIIMDEESGDIREEAREELRPNAHLRRDYPDDVMDERRRTDGTAEADVVVHGDPARSGRFNRAIDIGIFRRNAYRVRKEILNDWGGLSVKDGYITRNVRFPEFQEPGSFLDWLDRQNPTLVTDNFG
jgi:hypothetical protein